MFGSSYPLRAGNEDQIKSCSMRPILPHYLLILTFYDETRDYFAIKEKKKRSKNNKT